MLLPRCDRCGHVNPAGSRFCNACGAALDAGPSRPSPRGPIAEHRPPADPRRDRAPALSVGWLAVAALVVVALYGVYAWWQFSPGSPRAAPPAAQSVPAQPARGAPPVGGTTPAGSTPPAADAPRPSPPPPLERGSVPPDPCNERIAALGLCKPAVRQEPR